MGTETVTTRTITADAIGTVAIAVPKLSKVAKSRQHTARNASAWIPLPNRIVRVRASSRITKEMAIATTRTTTAVAVTMAVIAVPRLSQAAQLKPSFANNARAWIPLAVTVHASSPTTKEMATATTRTTTAVAGTMAVIAVPRLSQAAQLKPSFAKS